MSCKDCINSDVCECYDDEVTEMIAMNLNDDNCKLFKDKSKLDLLPKLNGRIAYVLDSICGVKNRNCKFDCTNCDGALGFQIERIKFNSFWIENIGIDLFFSIDEAVSKVEELNKRNWKVRIIKQFKKSCIRGVNND